MNKFINKISSLIEVKKIIALTVIFVYCGLAIKGKIEPNAFGNIVTLIVGFYFGQSTAKGIIKEGGKL